MKILNKIILLNIVIFMIFSGISKIKINTFASSVINDNYRKIVNVAVLIYNFEDPFLNKFRQGLDDIQKENMDKIKFTFYDGKSNAAIINQLFDNSLESNFDLIIVASFNTQEDFVKNIVSKAKQKNIPVIMAGATQKVAESISKYYNKVAFINPTSYEAGVIQGEIIAKLWNSNKKLIDKNNDDKLQHVFLQGSTSDQIGIDRTQSVISTINNLGIKTEQLANINTYWNKETAKSAIENLFIRYGNKIEVIIANNDYLALGAIEALQKYGYNTGDKSKYIAVFGIDGIQEAKDLVDKGVMTGTVNEDSSTFPKAVNTVGMNLLNNLPSTENTNYKVVDGEISIPLSYNEYIPKKDSKSN